MYVHSYEDVPLGGIKACRNGKTAYLDGVPVPDVALDDQRLEVGAPRVARPPQDLHEELAVCLERRCQGALGADLHAHLPVVLHDPPRHELVIS